jgi:hypothetical protein
VNGTLNGAYSQHFIFFATFKWAEEARVFVTGKPFQPDVMKHSSFLGPLISYEENKVL